ncbi:MAG: tRNA (guanosine(46)-N7)-methyltransferase TrmB, partial [Erysipelothrix sp.]|nr:tRNA (guanosine(46)-N7)-methyltransferase TrmB [Erysipelothrix sp.]
MRLRKRPWSQEMFELHQEILIDSEDDLKGKWKKT